MKKEIKCISYPDAFHDIALLQKLKQIVHINDVERSFITF